ncbi:YfgM family protein [Facilibium subflavum]|uniref:YfgM family protein n=1 Tax=Facilibium subflavum TaxID=2219058 RepID=UPI000E6579CC|nr:tetratricopeptide repeat protein [Facilibium subflavum]
MSEYLDQRETDKAKQIWKKYGRWLIGAICIVLIVIAAWQYWQNRQLQNNAQAAVLYQKIVILNENTTGATPAIIEQSKNLISLYPASIYADFARLQMAKQYIWENQLDKAKTTLQAVAKHSQNKNLQAIAKLRIARIDIAQNQLNQAIERLKSLTTPGYALSTNMILGDAYFKQKDYQAAKNAWQSALKDANTPQLQNVRHILQMKIDSLAVYTNHE